MSFKILIKEANARTISQAFGWLQPFKLHPYFHESNVAGVYGGKIARKKNDMGLFNPSYVFSTHFACLVTFRLRPWIDWPDPKVVPIKIYNIWWFFPLYSHYFSILLGIYWEKHGKTPKHDDDNQQFSTGSWWQCVKGTLKKILQLKGCNISLQPNILG